MARLYHGASSLRIQVTDSDLPQDCEWMKRDGYTEMYGLPFHRKVTKRLDLLDDMQGGFTWTTKRPGGFTDEHRAILDGHSIDLTTIMRYRISKLNCESLLQAYLGHDAGSRVCSGDICRGEGLVIRSVVWFSDIRGFTHMSCHSSRRQVIDVINGVFEATHASVQAQGGQILKFMGDGIMAIFSDSSHGFQRDSLSAKERAELDTSHGALLCQRAQKAACDLQQRLSQLQQEREAQGLHGASVGIGLHYGDVSYGNVGATDRLDFTVIGRAVNLASRIEGLCSKLQARVLASQQFVDLLGSNNVAWKNRGEFELKGIGDPVSVYELCD